MDVSDTLNMELATLLAGLLGVAMAILRRHRLSLAARAIGFCLGATCVLYVVPFLFWALYARYGWEVGLPGKNFISFLSGLVMVRLAESFIDDPVGTVKFYVTQLKRIRITPTSSVDKGGDNELGK